MRRARRRSTQVAGFALLALVGELTGRSVTLRVDRMLAVRPRVTPMASYYPFLLAGDPHRCGRCARRRRLAARAGPR